MSLTRSRWTSASLTRLHISDRKTLLPDNLFFFLRVFICASNITWQRSSFEWLWSRSFNRTWRWQSQASSWLELTIFSVTFAKSVSFGLPLRVLESKIPANETCTSRFDTRDNQVENLISPCFRDLVPCESVRYNVLLLNFSWVVAHIEYSFVTQAPFPDNVLL